MTSQTEMPSWSHISASSLASAMLTARKVFSCSLAVSATIGTRDRDHACRRSARRAARCGAGTPRVTPRDELRRVAHRVMAVARDRRARARSRGRSRRRPARRRARGSAGRSPPSCRGRSSTAGRRAGPARSCCGHRLRRRDDVGEVGRARLGQRRGDADRQRVELGDAPRSRSSRVSLPVDGRRSARRGRRRGRSGRSCTASHALVVEVDAGDVEAALRRTPSPAAARRSRGRRSRCAAIARRDALVERRAVQSNLRRATMRRRCSATQDFRQGRPAGLRVNPAAINAPCPSPTRSGPSWGTGRSCGASSWRRASCWRSRRSPCGWRRASAALDDPADRPRVHTPADPAHRRPRDRRRRSSFPTALFVDLDGPLSRAS